MDICLNFFAIRTPARIFLKAVITGKGEDLKKHKPELLEDLRYDFFFFFFLHLYFWTTPQRFFPSRKTFYGKKMFLQLIWADGIILSQTRLSWFELRHKVTSDMMQVIFKDVGMEQKKVFQIPQEKFLQLVLKNEEFLPGFFLCHSAQWHFPSLTKPLISSAAQSPAVRSACCRGWRGLSAAFPTQLAEQQTHGWRRCC